MTQTIAVSVVDDDSSLRNAVVSLLQAMDYTVSDFATAEEFLSSEQSGTTQCLIADIHMPGMSGVDLNSIMADRRKGLPVILMTARLEASLIADARRSNPFCILRKPFESAELIGCLDRAFSKN
jgi:FixJ family two-component response regulator